MPDRCQQFPCSRPAETWCPLCRAYFCGEHDELYPVRRHDCLRGKAEALTEDERRDLARLLVEGARKVIEHHRGSQPASNSANPRTIEAS